MPPYIRCKYETGYRQQKYNNNKKKMPAKTMLNALQFSWRFAMAFAVKRRHHVRAGYTLCVALVCGKHEYPERKR